MRNGQTNLSRDQTFKLLPPSRSILIQIGGNFPQEMGLKNKSINKLTQKVVIDISNHLN